MANNHKFESNKKYFTISIYTTVVILIGCIIFRFVTQWSTTSKLISQLWGILFPFFMGFLIAYILNPVVSFFQRNVSARILKSKPDKQRGLAILISYLVMVGCIIICLRFIIPQLYDSIRELSLMIPDIYNSIMSMFEQYRENSTDIFPDQIADMIETKTLPKLFELTNNLLTNIVPMLYEASMSFAKGLFNLFIAFIVSIYMTIDKFILKYAGKRIVLAIFNENFSYRVLRTLKDCHKIFSGFIIGKSIDSLIIGLLAFVAMTILKLPYTVLISVIIGITNMIPYFGPYIGTIPSALLILMDSPTKCLIFILFIIALQQVDSYLIEPRLCGSRTGLKSFWVLASILLFGNAFGIVGMLVAVPVFALIYGYFDNLIQNKLLDKKLPSDKGSYDDLERINSESKRLVKKTLK